MNLFLLNVCFLINFSPLILRQLSHHLRFNPKFQATISTTLYSTIKELTIVLYVWFFFTFWYKVRSRKQAMHE